MSSTEQHTSPRRRRGLIALGLCTAMLATTLAVAGTTGLAAAAAYDPATDPYSMASVTQHVAASQWWDAGYTGRGVDVAVIDTGVSPVPGLDTPDKLIHGPDLSFESQAPNLSHLDTNGHGTFMAGIIAGHDRDLTQPYSGAPATAYRGIAPDARIVSVKVGTADGAVDVSQVIAAIYWVIEHKNDNGLNIRVLNLSYGTYSTQPSDVDPLSYAAEQAWHAGIVVVAASGNTGYQRGDGAPGLSNPAYNPFVIAAGGYDSMGTPSPNDDQMGSYSASSAGCGSSCKNPDLVAMGSHLQGLRVPNGFVDSTHPEGRLGDRYFRGSGTSGAAAVTSGSVALILQKFPSLTPDQVKRFLTDNGKKVPGADSQAQGNGEIDLGRLLSRTQKPYVAKLNKSTGGGTLEGARGRDHVSFDGVELTGERDIFGNPFNAAQLARLAATGATWSGGTWNGATWSGATWSGATWSGATWSGATWSGATWSGATWSGATWSGATWSGATWSGATWSGATWSGSNWATGSWS